MNCKHVKENLSAYLDKVLDSEEMVLVEEHLASCQECREEYKALQETGLMLSSLEEVIPPASFRRELRRKLEEKTEKKRVSLNALIPNWMKRMNRTQLMPVAVVLVLMIVILPFVGKNIPRMGSTQKMADTGYIMENSAADRAEDQLAAKEELRKMIAPEGKGGESQAAVPERSAAGQMPSIAAAPNTPNNENMSPSVATVEEEIERKIIKNADVSLQVDDYDDAAEALKQKVAVMGGYVANESMSAMGRDGIINGYLQVRLPAREFENFLSGMEGIGKVKTRNIYTQDVTEEYVDVESRLKALRTKEERLLAILTKSGNLSDILAVENELANTRSQLESLQGRLRYLNNRTDFSSIGINIQQVAASTQQVSNAGLKDVLKKTKEAFIQAINNILIGIGKFIVFIGSAIPYLVLIAIAALLVWLWLRKKRA